MHAVWDSKGGCSRCAPVAKPIQRRDRLHYYITTGSRAGGSGGSTGGGASRPVPPGAPAIAPCPSSHAGAAAAASRAPVAHVGHMAVLGEGCASPDSAGLDSLLQGITPPSFDFLPLELRLKCLANCDWQTLSRAACASRSTRALVSGGNGRGGVRSRPAGSRWRLSRRALFPHSGRLPCALPLLADAR